MQEFRFRLPYSFLLLCRLWDCTPLEVLTDFMDNVSCGPVNRKHREEARQHVQEYILHMAYGQQRYYNIKDLENMFAELDMIGSIWAQANKRTLNRLTKHKEVLYDHWFAKWDRKKCKGYKEDEDDKQNDWFGLQ
jgi:hypothetical protein